MSAALEQFSDDVEKIAAHSKVFISVTGGYRYPSAIDLDVVGQKMTQEAADALANHFGTQIEVSTSPSGKGEIVRFKR